MFSNGLLSGFLSACMAKSTVFGLYSLRMCVDNGAQFVQRRKLPVMAAEAALANAQCKAPRGLSRTLTAHV